MVKDVASKKTHYFPAVIFNVLPMTFVNRHSVAKTHRELEPSVKMYYNRLQLEIRKMVQQRVSTRAWCLDNNTKIDMTLTSIFHCEIPQIAPFYPISEAFVEVGVTNERTKAPILRRR